jgi:hypothetical protein
MVPITAYGTAVFQAGLIRGKMDFSGNWESDFFFI